MPIPAMQGMDRNGKVIYFNSFSKSLAPSLRISYMVLPWDLVPQYRETLTFYACSVPIFEQKIVETWMNSGAFERHIFRMRNAYKERRDQIIQAFQKSTLSPVITISHHDAGLHFLLHVQNGMKEDELVNSAKTIGVRVYGYSNYFLTPGADMNDATVVIGYSAFPTADIIFAVRALEKAWLPTPDME
jgi:GntR family transcriptional regulator/MocR family aminotransferase